MRVGGLVNESVSVIESSVLRVPSCTSATRFLRARGY